MLDLIRPVIVAPMAGGPSTPSLVRGAALGGAVGFLAAGYKTPEAVEAELRDLSGSGLPYGLNIFVPVAPPADIGPVERYRLLLRAEADRYEVDLPPLRLDDDDHFAAKVELAAAYRVPLVSFTFGLPETRVLRMLHAAGCATLLTVTSADEARHAATREPTGLIAQAGSAGGHSATLRPADYQGTTTAPEILAAVRAVTALPAVVAGGTASAADARRLLAAGAAAVQCGTAFLLADEAGTRAAHRAAMVSGEYAETVVTRAFTGQPARALRNRFTDAYSRVAPVGYPVVHHLTAPIRAAAARLGDAGALNLWAGTGHRAARPGPVAELVAGLLPGAD
jgi:nitronate monooxygenase